MRRTRQAFSVITQVPDDALTEWAIDGDVKALGELYRRYARTGARFASVVSGRPQEAPDMVVDAFIMTLSEIAADESAMEDPFVARLLRSVRSIAVDRADGRGVDVSQLAAAVPHGTSPELLADAFNRLSWPQRSALWLCEVAGLSHANASFALGLSGGTASLRWTRSGSSGFDTLLTRARATLGEHPEPAIVALAALDVTMDQSHADALVARMPVRRNRILHSLRAAWSWIASTFQRELTLTDVVRLAAIAVFVAGAIGLLVDQRNSGTAQAGANNGASGPVNSARSGADPAKGGDSRSHRNKTDQKAKAKGGPASSQERSSGQAGERADSSSFGSASGVSATAAAASGTGASIFTSIGADISAVDGTTLGIGAPSTGSPVGTVGTIPAGGLTPPPTTGPPPTSAGPPSTDRPTTTKPPSATPTTRPPTTRPPTTRPPTTQPPTTRPPSTLPPTTQPPTTRPPFTLPPTTQPPTTRPPFTLPPTTQPPTTEPPTTEPIITLPPITLPPISLPLPP